MIRSSVETITPEMAKEILTSHNAKNRKISSAVVNRYASDMKHGRWQLNGEPIQFDKFGNLLNGQHRLLAVYNSGIPTEFLVVRDIEEGIHIYDSGRRRNYSDILAIEGYSTTRSGNSYVSAAKEMLTLLGQSNPSYAMVREFIDSHGDAIEEVMDYIPKTRPAKTGFTLKNSCMIAAMTVALECGYDERKLQKFADICKTGFYDTPNETAAVVIRNQMASGDISLHGRYARAKYIMCVEAAIHDFCTGKERKKKYASTSHTFVDGWREKVKQNDKSNSPL